MSWGPPLQGPQLKARATARAAAAAGNLGPAARSIDASGGLAKLCKQVDVTPCLLYYLGAL